MSPQDKSQIYLIRCSEEETEQPRAPKRVPRGQRPQQQQGSM